MGWNHWSARAMAMGLVRAGLNVQWNRDRDRIDRADGPFAALRMGVEF